MERPWTRFYDGHVSPHLEYPLKLLPQILDNAAKRSPEKLAIFFFGGKLTYRALQGHVDRFAGALTQVGFRRGDPLGIILPNMPQTVVSAYGALKAGGVVFLFDPLAAQEELERQLEEAKVETLVVLDLVLPRLEPLLPRMHLRGLIVTGVKDFLPPLRGFLFNLAARGKGMKVKVARRANLCPFPDFLRIGRPDQVSPEEEKGKPEDTAVVLYTRGMSGPPAGVRLTHQNLMASLYQTAAWAGQPEKEGEAFLSVLPFHHSFGFTLSMSLPLFLGAGSIYLPRFELEQVLSAAKSHPLSFFPAFPSMIERLATYPDLAKFKIPAIKNFWSIGDALEEEAQRNFERRTGRKVMTGYGLSETCAFTHANPAAGPEKPGSIGIPLPDTDAKIVRPDQPEQDLPAGEVGELIVRGPQVMKGYWKSSGKATAGLRENWLHTGDLARMDEDGFFYIQGRRK
jgi:long-chain acyl-CoA synthetase